MTNSEHKVERFLKLLREAPMDHSAQEFGFETRLMARIRERARNSMTGLAWKLMPFLASGILLLTVILVHTVAYGEYSKTATLLASSPLDSHDDVLNLQ